MTFDPQFTNIDESGLRTDLDGHDTQWNKEVTLEEYNTTYVTSEALEVEPQLADEQ